MKTMLKPLDIPRLGPLTEETPNQTLASDLLRPDGLASIDVEPTEKATAWAALCHFSRFMLAVALVAGRAREWQSSPAGC